MANTAQIVQLDERRPAVKADTDDGWFKVANALSAKACRTRMSDQERRLFLAIQHLTFGFRKSMDWLAASQISELADIPANKVSELKKRLVERRILKVDGRKVGINTTISEWIEKQITPVRGYKSLPLNQAKITPISDKSTPESGKKDPQTGVHHKKTTTKERKDIDLVGQPDDASIFQRVIDHLNLKTGKAFKNVKSHQKFISARLKEGYSESDLITVIDRKAIEWLTDPRMNEYLRPSTLFNSEKFDGYLNAKAVPQQRRSNGPFIPDNHDTSWGDGFRPYEPETF